MFFAFFLCILLNTGSSKLNITFDNIGLDAAKNVFFEYSCKGYNNETIVFYVKKINADSTYKVNRKNLSKYKLINGDTVHQDQFSIPLKANKISVLVIAKNDTIRRIIQKTLRPSMGTKATREIERASDYIVIK